MAQVRVQTFTAGNGDPASRLVSDETITVPDPQETLEDRVASLEARVSELEILGGVL